MKQLKIYLFPHCCPTETALNKALETFGNLRICLPWYMEAPEAVSKLKEDPRITIIYPPETLRPNSDFPLLLSEYRLWMKENRGKGLSPSPHDLQNNDASWEIRKIIRSGTGGDSETQRTRITRWHLILHLAGALEKENAEAEEELRRLQASGSPLKEALGDEDLAKGLFDDLPITSPSPSSEKCVNRFRYWTGAWFSLFGSLLEPEAALLTVDRDIFAYVTDLREGPVPGDWKLADPAERKILLLDVP